MIRSELDVLLDKIQDPALRADLRSQIDRLKQRRSFGLVFEQHIPERVRLPQHPISVGSQVVSRDDDTSATFEVVAIEDGVATLVRVRDSEGAYVQRSEHGAGGLERAPIDSLVVITDFGEPVLPGLRHLGSIERGGDRPYHVVIKGENHHALEMLRFTHAGKVDCIYIDPPYNSGARDWKYNNDYVDETDAYRHSKWLAFMERRLRLARELMNPDRSVLVVTIDEREYLRLGMLLRQTFPDSRMQMVSTVINPKGVPRSGFSRVDEYIFVLQFGRMTVSGSEVQGSAGSEVRWRGLARTGANAVRSESPGAFYPIYFSVEGEFHSIGDALAPDEGPASVNVPPGLIAVWPPRRPDGREGRWSVVPATLRDLRARGAMRLGRIDVPQKAFPISYLTSEQLKQIESGDLLVVGRRPDGSLIVAFPESRGRVSAPRTVWDRVSHSASEHGSMLLKEFLPDRTFPFPKSLYAVEDAIRLFVKDKEDAVVLDFFAGSGTTTHAVARLNRQDGGRRLSIMVTNNEVSVEEAAQLRARGLRPGDPEWEALGIFEHITRPRVTAAITGRTPEGEPIAGDYKFTDEFPMAEGFEENVAFFELRYLAADDVDLGLAFDDLAPLLWLCAGAQGPIANRLDENGALQPFVWTSRYGILFDEDRWRAFVSERPEAARTAFIMTHSPTTFTGITAELPPDIEVVRLPDSYLSMFVPDRGRA